MWALSSLQSPITTVIRGGEEVQVDSAYLVPGDVVKLGTGDVVPADLRMVKASDLRVNEMLLTGMAPRTRDLNAFLPCRVRGPAT